MSSALPTLTELVSIKTLQRLQDNFAEALGISAVVLDLEMKPLTKGRFNSVFLAHNCPSNQKEAMKAMTYCKTHIYECQSGVFSFGAPIMVEGRPVGMIKGGQVRLGNPDLKLCKVRAERLGVTFDKFLEEYLSLPLFTRERLSAAADLLRMVASTISSMAFAGLSAEEEIQQITYINDLLEAEVKRKTADLERTKERYRALVENAEDVIYTVDPEGIITSINPAVTRMAGYEPSEVIGHHFSEFVCKDDLEKVRGSFFDILKGTKLGTSSMEFRLNHKKGGDRWVELNSRGIRNFNGELFEIEGVLRDVTAAQKQMADLEASERKYRLLFEHSSKPIFLMNGEGVFLNVNRAMVRFLGYDEMGEIEGRRVRELVPEEFREEYERVMSTHFVTPGVEDSALVVLLKKNGEKVLADITFSRVSDDIFMGVLWHQRQRPSMLAKSAVKHHRFEQLSQFLKN